MPYRDTELSDDPWSDDLELPDLDNVFALEARPEDGDPAESDNVFERYSDPAEPAWELASPRRAPLGDRLGRRLAAVPRPSLRFAFAGRRRRAPSPLRAAALAACAAIVALTALTLRGGPDSTRVTTADGRGRAARVPQAEQRERIAPARHHRGARAQQPAAGGGHNRYRRRLGRVRNAAGGARNTTGRDRHRPDPGATRRRPASRQPAAPHPRPAAPPPSPPAPAPVNPAAGAPAATEFGFEG